MSDSVPEPAERLLTSEPLMAHFATSVDDRPHVAPVWYVYGDGAVELVTSGRKLRNVRENPRVALSVQKDEGGQTEWTVTLLGTATVVEDEAAFREANRRINRKYGAPENAHAENALVRVDVGTASYRTYD
ncbi:pyridoxamine 5'-phosphate oxidase family protein [Halostella sp. JP-L12]|uniref:pyridoxamine 5'-phosphate oxidase family protein n=1 Tax=Halostella TaxID=1843185 RepID=UPI000EF7B6A5|nr:MULTISPECIES: pyridoxamine 5'-phosphate oxidase family protein [Halostella]NHN49075.1 pyridoxamine 5'-phosphate oxidase family protein [Halostella sp. JP-L12]